MGDGVVGEGDQDPHDERNADQLQRRAEILNGFQTMTEGEDFFLHMMCQLGSEADDAAVQKLGHALA